MALGKYVRYSLVMFFILCLIWLTRLKFLSCLLNARIQPTNSLGQTYRLFNATPLTITKSDQVQLPSAREECHVVHSKLNTCNKLPNYFLHESRRRDFDQSIINFWHIQKAGGSTVAHCMVNMVKELNLPETFHGGPSCKKKDGMVDRSAYFTNVSLNHPIVRGHGTLGLCDFIHDKITTRNCSTFALFRDPVERAVSNYFFNRQIATKLGHTTGGFAKALQHNITEWLKQVGSVTLQGFANEWRLEEKGNSQEICKEQRSSIVEVRGWRLVDGFLQSIIDNMDRHFSVIGITEDLESTYEILEFVYGLPFTKTCIGLHIMKGKYDSITHTKQETLKADAKRQLMEDEEVMKLLQFDILIYQRAKEIFYQQKIILENYKQVYN
ncbi:uncharacterized protein [Apostichopus japonicus]|uniref:uncharacterized protein n=1 Tax=Stichopus japonicus TaxID=307972 RepID=UPI003AB48F35